MNKATQRPWTIDGACSAGLKIAGKDESLILAHVINYSEDDDKVTSECQANADLIVRAVNAHDDLVSALEEFISLFIDTKKYPDPETITTGLRIFLPKAQAAIKKSKKGKEA